MTLVTEVSDTVLWDALNLKWQEERNPGYIVHGGIHYYVCFDSLNKVQFDSKTNRELFDDRSIIESRSASYSNLDE